MNENYNMNGNYNNGNYNNGSYDPNGGYNNNANYGANPYGEQYYTSAAAQPVPPKKKAKAGTAIALALLVAVVGGASGFGGAYLAGRVNTSGSAPGTAPNGSSAVYDSGKEDDRSSTAERDEAVAGSNVEGAINSIYASSASAELSGKKDPGSITPTGPNGTYTSSELYEAVNDTIVLIKIYTKKNNSFDDFYYNYYFYGYGDREPQKTESEPILSGYGSGIIFTDDGYILTNAHIADGAARLEVIVNDYSESGVTHSYDAKVVGSDTHTDVAILKIERDEPFRAAAIGDSDTLKVGQDICALGNPGVNGSIMFTHSMTKGIISGLDRVSLSTGYSTSSIQIDAAINGGNSGGALFDMYGNVVGIVNKKIVVSDIENIGFAIPINEAKPIMEDLINYGYVKSRPILGITTIELNEYRAQTYGTKLSKGLLVTGFSENSAAKNSDLRESDIITKIEGVNVETVSDVQKIIKNMKPGDKITATVARTRDDGKVDSVEVEMILSSSFKSE